jgi:hypothetical protein
MVVALTAALAVGMVVAVLANPDDTTGAVYAFVAGWLAALVIAALLLAPVAAYRRLQGVRPAWPRGPGLATALAVGGLVVFPVHAGFYLDAESAAAGGGVGRCTGIAPLPAVVLFENDYAPFAYFASCDD